MTVLEVLHSYRQTEEVFKRYEERAGECIMCQALFESLKGVAERYGLDLARLLRDLEAMTEIS